MKIPNNSLLSSKKMRTTNKQEKLMTNNIDLSILDNIERERVYSISDEEFDTYTHYKTIFRKDRNSNHRQRVAEDLKIPIQEYNDMKKNAKIIEIPSSK